MLHRYVVLGIFFQILLLDYMYMLNNLLVGEAQTSQEDNIHQKN